MIRLRLRLKRMYSLIVCSPIIQKIVWPKAKVSLSSDREEVHSDQASRGRLEVCGNRPVALHFHFSLKRTTQNPQNTFQY